MPEVTCLVSESSRASSTFFPHGLPYSLLLLSYRPYLLYFSTLCAIVTFYSTRGCLAFFKVSGCEGFAHTFRPSDCDVLGGCAADPVADPVAAVEDSATDAEGSTTPDSTASVAKDVAAPDTTRGVEGTCSPESTDWGADDQVLEERWLKNALGHAQRTHKSQTAP